MRKFLLIFLSAILSSCAVPVKPVSSDQLKPTQTTSRTFEKNYSINSELKEYVGNSIIKVKDYYTVKTEYPALSPSAPYKVVLQRQSFEFNVGNEYPITSKLTIDGVDCSLIMVQSSSSGWNIYLAIDPEGNSVRQVFWKNGFGQLIKNMFPGSTSFEGTAVFSNVVKTKIDTSKGFVNHELVYNGTDGKSIFLTYREFSPDDIARPAFYQNLTYENKSDIIRFKNYRIKLIRANDESMSYVVVEDGLPQ